MYSFKINPEIPMDSRKLRYEISILVTLVAAGEKEISAKIGSHWVSGANIFSRKFFQTFTAMSKVGSQDYEISITFRHKIDFREMQEGSDSFETSKQFLEIMIKQVKILLRQTKL